MFGGSTASCKSSQKREKNLGSGFEGEKMVTNKPNPNILHLEDYQLYFDNSHGHGTNNLSVSQLNQIVHMHGFFKPSGDKRRKDVLLEMLSKVDWLLEPTRSTLNDNVSPYSCSGLTIEQVNADLDELQWMETPVLSLQSHPSFNSSNSNSHSYRNNGYDFDDNGGAQMAKRQHVRVRKAKERKVFDAIHLTKPRSRKSRLKKKHLSEIGSSACLG